MMKCLDVEHIAGFILLLLGTVFMQQDLDERQVAAENDDDPRTMQIEFSSSNPVRLGSDVSIKCKGRVLTAPINSAYVELVHGVSTVFAYHNVNLKKKNYKSKLECRVEDCSGTQLDFEYNKPNFVLTLTLSPVRDEHFDQWLCRQTVSDKFRYTTAKAAGGRLECETPPSVDIHIQPDVYQEGGVIMEHTPLSVECRGNLGLASRSLKVFVMRFLDSKDDYVEVKDGGSRCSVLPISTEVDLSKNTSKCDFMMSVTSDFVVVQKYGKDIALMCALIDEHRFTVHDSCLEAAFAAGDVRLLPKTVKEYFIERVDEEGTWLAEFMDTGDEPKREKKELSCKDDIWLIFGVSASTIVVLVLILESVYYLIKKTQELRIAYMAKKYKVQSIDASQREDTDF